MSRGWDLLLHAIGEATGHSRTVGAYKTTSSLVVRSIYETFLLLVSFFLRTTVVVQQVFYSQLFTVAL